jgi:hypothetical protein
MRLSTVLLSLISIVSAAPSNTKTPSTFAQREVFTPPADSANWTDPKVLYARSAQLKDGSLIATWENYSPEPPQVYFPIYHSKDGGYTWKERSRVQDQVNGWGLRYQPFLYVLDKPFAGYKAGTVLLAGSSIPKDLSVTQIELYASVDSGKTWKFVSHIARGGEAVPNNGLTPVWEPFLMVYRNKLICYYSDQRDPKYGQKMVHQTTTDLKTWGPVVDDVRYPTYTDRPGMPTVALLPNGKYIMSYEYGGGPHGSDTSYQFPVHYKIASDPEKFDAAVGLPVVATNGVIPFGSPYIVWSPVGGKNGTIIVSAHSSTDVFINKGLGYGDWVAVPTPEKAAYTRHLRVLKDQKKLLIMGGGELPPTDGKNRVEVSVMDISKL